MVDQEEVQVFDVSDITERAVKTAVEAGIAAVPFVAFTDISYPVLVAAGMAAGAAGVSVILNALKQWSQSKKSKVQL